MVDLYENGFMPVTKSAKKALRQTVRRRKKNLSESRKLKAAIKQYKKLTGSGKLEEADKYLPTVYKSLDKAAKTKLIKKNKASRLKSRLSHQLNVKSTKISS